MPQAYFLVEPFQPQEGLFLQSEDRMLPLSHQSSIRLFRQHPWGGSLPQLLVEPESAGGTPPSIGGGKPPSPEDHPQTLLWVPVGSEPPDVPQAYLPWAAFQPQEGLFLQSVDRMLPLSHQSRKLLRQQPLMGRLPHPAPASDVPAPPSGAPNSGGGG